MQYSRSPPPLQHPRPQHPPSQIPSTSPPPDAHLRGAAFGAGTPDFQPGGDYQRFSSPGVNSAQQQQFHGGGGSSAYADTYVPSGLSGAGVSHAYAPSQQQQQQQFFSAVGSGNETPANANAGGGMPWMGAMGAMGQAAMAGGGANGQWPGVNDATTAMGMQFGAQALGAGQAYLDKNVSRLLPLAHLKHSFDVSHSYVARKIGVVLWPWRHKTWARSVARSESTGVSEGWKSPREDINCPDLYIPLMALCTYILMSSVASRAAPTSVNGQAPVKTGFDPSHLGNTASSAFGLVFLEFMCLKLGTYLLGIGEEGTVVDLVAYEGYKFVGVIVTLVAGLLGAKGWLFWLVFLYVFLANFFFQLRSLRHLILPDPSMSPLDHSSPTSTSATMSHAARSRRIQFLFVVAAAQAPVMAILVLV